MTTTTLFNKTAFIGIGLIGSSLALAMKQHGLTNEIHVGDINQDHCDQALSLKIADTATTNLAAAVKDADLVIIAAPVAAYKTVGEAISPHLKANAILTDVGSVKESIINDLEAFIPSTVQFVPAHPISGTENSGPTAGFSSLFENRWTILTPHKKTTETAVKKIRKMWEQCGANVEIMSPGHHDRVFAVTSHLPHLIAYTIVGTATDLEDHLESEVIKYSAGGFRDFTRIAASDPTMWRDIFLKNKTATLDVLQRFTEDLTALQRAIRHDDGETLHTLFTRTRDTRRQIIDIEQHRYKKGENEC